MKVIIVSVLLAFFGTAYGVNDTALVIEFAECALRAAGHGIEGLIPPHDPLQIRDIDVAEEFLGIGLTLNITNNFMYGLMDYEFRKVDVTSFTEPDRLSIDYDVYWRIFNFTGNYAYNFSLFGLEFVGSGSYNVVLDHTDFLGVFNLTKSGQEAEGINPEVTGFTLNITVLETESYVPEANAFTNTLIKDAFFFLMNHVSPALGDFLKVDRFNEFWIDHPETIKEVSQWCADNPAA